MNTPQQRGGHPKFGDLLRNTAAGEKNPHRDAYFIRKVYRTGSLNPGLWYEQPAGPAVGGWLRTGEWFASDNLNRVTHWMPRVAPLPPTPTQEQKA